MKGIAIKQRIAAAEMKLYIMNENREFNITATTMSKEDEAQLNRKIKAVIDSLPFDDLGGGTAGNERD